MEMLCATSNGPSVISNNILLAVLTFKSMLNVYLQIYFLKHIYLFIATSVKPAHVLLK